MSPRVFVSHSRPSSVTVAAAVKSAALTWMWRSDRNPARMSVACRTLTAVCRVALAGARVTGAAERNPCAAAQDTRARATADELRPAAARRSLSCRALVPPSGNLSSIDTETMWHGFGAAGVKVEIAIGDSVIHTGERYGAHELDVYLCKCDGTRAQMNESE